MRIGIYKTPNMTEWYPVVLRDALCDIGVDAHIVTGPQDAHNCFGDDITLFVIFGHSLEQALKIPAGNIREHSKCIALVQTEQAHNADMFRNWIIDSQNHADVILETAPELLSYTRTLTDKPVIPMPLGFHHSLFHAPHTPMIPPFDIFLLESCTIYREPFFNALRDNGLSHANVSSFDPREIGALARGAKICLTTHAYGDGSFLSSFRVIGLFVHNRGFVMSQRADYPYLEENKHIVYFDTPDEMVDKCRYYLAHQDEARRIADAAHEHIKKTLPMEAVMRGVIGEIENNVRGLSR